MWGRFDRESSHRDVNRASTTDALSRIELELGDRSTSSESQQKMARPTWVQTDGWKAAVFLCETYLRKPQKTDVLLQRLSADFPSLSLRRCQALFLGVIRNLKLIEWAIDTLIARRPKRRLKSILFVSTFELLAADPADHPKIVHHGVSRARELVSPHEASLVNAVLKRLPEQLSSALAAVGRDSYP